MSVLVEKMHTHFIKYNKQIYVYKENEFNK